MGFVENLAWTRDRSGDEQTYLDAKGTLRIGDEQQGLANLGDPAIYFLTGSIGSTIRAVAATNGALQFTQGTKQSFEGDGWNAAGNLVAGLLGMATLGAGVKDGAGSVVTSDPGSIKPVVSSTTRKDPVPPVQPNTGKYLEDFTPYLRSPNVTVTRITGEADEFGVSKGYVSIRDPQTNSWANKKS